jgi:hypothetical protein
MPLHDDISGPAKEWVQVNEAPISSARIINIGRQKVWIQATETAAEPTSRRGGIPIDPGFGITSDTPLSSIFGGVTGAAYLWARSEEDVDLSVSAADA